MHHLLDEPADVRGLPPSHGRLLPAAVAGMMLSLLFFGLLFVI